MSTPLDKVGGACTIDLLMDYQVKFRVTHSVADLDPRQGRFLDRDAVAEALPPGTYLVFPVPLEPSSHVSATEVLDPEGTWEATYLLALRDGSPVVSEMRIASGRGVEVPEKGLPSRVTNSAHPDRVRRLSHRFFVDAAQQLGREFVETQLERAAFTYDSLANPPVKATGRPRLLDAELAKTAILYAGFIEDGSLRPVMDSATQLNLSRAAVADRLQRARRRGFLTEAPGKGIAGGTATPKAHQMELASETRDLSDTETDSTQHGGIK